eukprot:TRINITY_DN16451_c0_g1_i1.p1 TRINITY_DN16451_c0_g1~~TRINITY_DN16451_c0_g1_i1.p1  ORF type:complete len:334 (-),score=64.38 TRINITY_DN16451_c0_g1_i1:19-1020(-)
MCIRDRPEMGKHFAVEDVPFDAELKEGEIILEAKYISVDPYLRGRMKDIKSYSPGFQIGSAGVSGTVLTCTASNNKDHPIGGNYIGYLPWRTHHKLDYTDEKTVQSYMLNKIPDMGLPLSSTLSVVGMPGATAYFGLLHITEPKEGETVLVTGAAGAVGSIVCQIAKIKKCRVIGIAGSDEKLEYLKSLGVDATINYKKTTDMDKSIKEAADGKGIDVFFDNVGGEIADVVWNNMNVLGRVSQCGAISTYNAAKPPLGPRRDFLHIAKQIRCEGFLVFRWKAQMLEAFTALGGWIKEGKLTYKETIRDGFENLIPTFNEMMQGGNIGKMIVKV